MVLISSMIPYRMAIAPISIGICANLITHFAGVGLVEHLEL